MSLIPIQFRRVIGHVFLGFCLCLLPGCQTMKEHSVVAGAVIGAVGGAALGAAIDSDDPGRGALIGAAAGAAVGAGAGYAARKYFKNVEARSASNQVLSQERTNEVWEQSDDLPPLPGEAVPVLVSEESRILPGDRLRPGQEATFSVAYAAFGERPYPGSLCRYDKLYLLEEGEEPFLLWEEEGDCSLPTEGVATHETVLPLPAESPSGQYQMQSRILDPDNADLAPIEKAFTFEVVEQTAAVR